MQVKDIILAAAMHAVYAAPVCTRTRPLVT
jgi:hypothetical protein